MDRFSRTTKGRKTQQQKRNQSTPINYAFHRVSVEGDDGGQDLKSTSQKVLGSLLARHKYKSIDQGQNEAADPFTTLTTHQLFQVDGVIRYQGQTTNIMSYSQFAQDIMNFQELCESSTCQNACRHRLNILEEKYEIYNLLNTDLEESTDKLRHGGGVYGPLMKVDNAVRLSTASNAHDLIQFIVKMYNEQGNEVVMLRDHNPVTLRGLFEHHGIRDPSLFTVEGLGLHPSTIQRFHKFDIFSSEFNRGGLPSAEIMRIFLRHNTHNHGAFYSSIVRPILEQGESQNKIATEFKIPLFGFSREEWFVLAKWIRTLRSPDKEAQPLTKNRWVIQIPRIQKLKDSGEYHCSNVMEQIEHIFTPLFEATLKRQDPKYADIDFVLSQVGAFNLFSDSEGTLVVPPAKPPYDWSWSDPAPDTYFAYYIWANLCSLNSLRHKKGLNTFQFRPTCGEVAKTNEMLYLSFFLADQVNHGLTIMNNSALQYMYFLGQIGMHLSPLSNNALYVNYTKSPFPTLFKRGIPVTLCTDDPMHFHHTNQPLVEEYSTAQRLFKLSSTDIAEIARTSVLLSSFDEKFKKEYLGDNYSQGIEGNSFAKTCVPHIRLCFREDTLKAEFDILKATLHHTLIADMEVILKSRKWSYHPKPYDGLDVINVSDRTKYCRMNVHGPPEREGQFSQAAEFLYQAIHMRSKYIRKAEPWKRPTTKKIEEEFKKNASNDLWFCDVQGVWMQKEAHKSPQWPRTLPALDQFIADFNEIKKISADPAVKALSQRQLNVLLHKFNLHLGLNGVQEAGTNESKALQNRDFYQTYKVDTHVHMAAGMTARQLLNFIVMKARNHGDEFVIQGKTGTKTLSNVLTELDVKPDTLTVDMLQVQADATLFERFDNFNDKYNPLGNGDMRTILLKTSNYIGGRYFAEMAKMTFEQFSRDKYTFAENRLSVYGREYDEWNKLAIWFDTNGVSSPHNKWMIQVPRIYPLMKKAGAITSFGQLLQNVFEPLWEVSIYPARYPKLHYFLRHVSGFDSVDNEAEIDISCPNTPPHEYIDSINPPYIFWMYFMWANIRTLNEFRTSKGLSTFSFRPHCGESGSTEHLIGNFLVADAINHGINLRLDPVLQYLYYLAQVGLAVSPLSNNSLFLDYLQNPFPFFFKRGLNVSLSTDDPLQFHHTQEPLLEEYSIASKVWKLSPNDLCEIARNSVIQSGFDHKWKCQAIGAHYFLSSSAANSLSTHLSDIRMAFRFEVYHAEVNYLQSLVQGDLQFRRALFTLDEEREILKSLREAAVDEDAETEVTTHEMDRHQLEQANDIISRLQDEVDELKAKNQRLLANMPSDDDWRLTFNAMKDAQPVEELRPNTQPDKARPGVRFEETLGNLASAKEPLPNLPSVEPHPPALPPKTKKPHRLNIVDDIQRIIENSELLWSKPDIDKVAPLSQSQLDNLLLTSQTSETITPVVPRAPSIAPIRSDLGLGVLRVPAPFSGKVQKPSTKLLLDDPMEALQPIVPPPRSRGTMK